MKAARALLRPLLPLIRSAAMHHVTTPVRAASSLSRGAWRTMETNPRFTRGLQLSIEPTPNPDSEKFIPEGQVVLPPELGKGMQFSSVAQATGATDSKLVRQLLKLGAVTSVYLGPDFITVNKREVTTWKALRPLVMSTIMDAYAEGKPLVTVKGPGPPANREEAKAAAAAAASVKAVSPEEQEIIDLIEELLETRIRPAVQEDGGDIFFSSWDHDTGTVKLRMAGSCVGCPSSSATLKQGVESMLMHYIPEVQRVERVDDEPLQKVNEAELTELEMRLRTAGVPDV